jgi:hypothetical protein
MRQAETLKKSVRSKSAKVYAVGIFDITSTELQIEFQNQKNLCQVNI